MEQQIETWLNSLKDKCVPIPGREITYILEPGRKYTKVVLQETWQDGDKTVPAHKSVHAFVDNLNGDIYKAAGWRAKADGVRYNVIRDIDLLVQVCDPYGSYLYKR